VVVLLESNVPRERFVRSVRKAANIVKRREEKVWGAGRCSPCPNWIGSGRRDPGLRPRPDVVVPEADGCRRMPVFLGNDEFRHLTKRTLECPANVETDAKLGFVDLTGVRIGRTIASCGRERCNAQGSRQASHSAVRPFGVGPQNESPWYQVSRFWGQEGRHGRTDD
jgi:hypothetical protein